MSDFLRIAAMAASLGLIAGTPAQTPIRLGGFKPDPAPQHPTKKRAKVKAARRQRRKDRLHD